MTSRRLHPLPSLTVAAALLFASAAHANAPAFSSLQSPVGAQGLLAIDRSDTEAPGQFAVRLDADYVEAPLALAVDASGVAASGERTVVDRAVGARVTLAVGLMEGLELGVSAPASFTQLSDGGRALVGGPAHTTGEDIAGGDLRVHYKLRLARGDRGALALVAAATFPTGDTATFRSSGLASGEPRLVGDLLLGRVTLAAEVGARLHASTVAVDAQGTRVLAIGNELTYAAAATVAVRARVPNAIDLSVEIAGSEDLESRGAAQRTLELLASLGWRPRHDVTVQFGLGRSLVDGARRDEVRVLAAVAWRPLAPPPPPPVEVRP